MNIKVRYEKLSNYCDLQNGFAFKSKDYISQSSTMNFRMSQIRPGGYVDLENNPRYLPDEFAKIYSNFLLKEGDIVIAMTDMAAETKILGIPTIVPKDSRNWLLNQRVAKLTNLDLDSLDIKYLKYVLTSESVVNYFKDCGKGGLQINIGKNDILNTIIPVPPLSEQQQIVEKLDTAFDLIDRAKANIEKNIQNAKELFQSKLNQVFSEKSEGWEEKTLGEIGKVSMCKRIMKDQTLPEGDIPFYKIGTFGKSPNAFISREIFNEYSTKYSYPKKGEILLSASGTIGRCVIFDGEPSFFQDSNIVWISNNEKMVLNDFLFHFYKICDWNPSKGATISRLYNDDLRRIKINFPVDLKVQKEIVEKVEQLNGQTKVLQQKYLQKLANLEELKKSILEKAFKGELM